MKYQNMNVKVPQIEAKLTAEDFYTAWTEMLQQRNKLLVMVEPAIQATRERYGRHLQLIDNGIDLQDGKISDPANATLVLTFEYWTQRDHDVQETSFSIPLDAAMHSVGAVLLHFDNEKQRQEQAAIEAGIRKVAREKEDRRVIFERLKVEFEPPINAIIKP